MAGCVGSVDGRGLWGVGLEWGGLDLDFEMKGFGLEADDFDFEAGGLDFEAGSLYFGAEDLEFEAGRLFPGGRRREEAEEEACRGGLI